MSTLGGNTSFAALIAGSPPAEIATISSAGMEAKIRGRGSCSGLGTTTMTLTMSVSAKTNQMGNRLAPFEKKSTPYRNKDGLLGIVSQEQSPCSGNTPECIYNYRPSCMTFVTFGNRNAVIESAQASRTDSSLSLFYQQLFLHSCLCCILAPYSLRFYTARNPCPLHITSNMRRISRRPDIRHVSKRGINGK